MHKTRDVTVSSISLHCGDKSESAVEPSDEVFDIVDTPESLKSDV